MSAIWGVVDFAGRGIGDEELPKRMEQPYHACQIDTFATRTFRNGFAGYGGQWFTPEARYETLPLVDERTSGFFVADAVLDNRSELLSMLGMAEASELPDGSIMQELLRIHGQEAYPLFLGTFSFCRYDTVLKEVHLAADAFASRSLYYLYEEGRLYFSTLIQPIIAARGRPPSLNDRYLADYLALNDLSLYTEPEETPFTGIFKVAPGQVVAVSDCGVRKYDYWKPPIDGPRLRGSDAEIREETIRVFRTSVEATLRSPEKTGILLSGGLDSTSIASFAARRLHEKGEELRSYTSVPEADFPASKASYYVPDERPYVEMTKGFLGNLDCSFLELPGRNGFDEADHLVRELELPYKSLQNMVWISEAAHQARRDGCRLLLTGTFGNGTLSYGEDIFSYYYSLLRRGRIFAAAREIQAFHRKFRASRRKLTGKVARDFLDGLIMISRPEPDFDHVYVNPELIRRFDTRRRFSVLRRNLKKTKPMTIEQQQKFLVGKEICQQAGEFETRFSLLSGVLLRDPTRDRRLVSFCLSLPERHFCHNGVSRRLVREYLRSYIPEQISQDYAHRGLQSADMIQRLRRNWERIDRQCLALLESETASRLLDVPRLAAKLEEYRAGLPEGQDFEVLKTLYSVLLVKYARQWEDEAESLTVSLDFLPLAKA